MKCIHSDASSIMLLSTLHPEQNFKNWVPNLASPSTFGISRLHPMFECSQPDYKKN